jgi:hypothetical protein
MSLLVEPTVTPEPVPKFVDKADMFADKLTSGGCGPLMIQVPDDSFRLSGAMDIVTTNKSPRHHVQIRSGWDRKNHTDCQKPSGNMPRMQVQHVLNDGGFWSVTAIHLVLIAIVTSALTSLQK